MARGEVTREGKALSSQVGESTKRNHSTSTGLRRLQVLAFVEIYTPLSTCRSPQGARLRLGLGERKLLGYKERRESTIKFAEQVRSFAARRFGAIG